MIWLVELLFEALAGASIICRFLRNRTSWIVIVGMAYPVGMALSSLTFFISSAIFGFNVFHLAIHIILLLVLIAVFMDWYIFKLIDVKRDPGLPFFILSFVVAFVSWKMYFPTDGYVLRAFQSDIA